MSATCTRTGILALLTALSSAGHAAWASPFTCALMACARNPDGEQVPGEQVRFKEFSVLVLRVALTGCARHVRTTDGKPR